MVKRLLQLALLTAVAGYTASTLLGDPTAVTDSVYVSVFFLGAALCGHRAVTDRAERIGWGLVGLGLLLIAVGELSWAAWIGKMDPIPWPSVSDLAFLASYAALYGGVVALVRARVRVFHASMWLDGAVSALAVTAAAAGLAFGPIVAGTNGDPVQVAVTLAYPVADLLLLALVVGVFALTGWRPGAWVLIGAGLGLFAVADTIYLHQEATGTYVEGTPLDVVWPLGCAILALAATVTTPARELVLDRWRVLVIPAVAASVALSVLVIGGLSEISPLPIALAAAAVLAAIGRMFLTFHEVRQLAETRRLALTDDLTGLPNRRAFSGELDRCVRQERPVALLLVDLDHFKELNDTLGHGAGDALLGLLGPRLGEALRDGDLLARLGGDEFGVLLRDPVSAELALEVAERLRSRLDRPFIIDEISIQVDASVGIALHPEHADDAESLLRHADVAMYQAKRDRSGTEVYAADRDRHSRDRLALIGDLREGIARGELELHYQPKVALSDGAVAGVEALVRWRHPTRGLLFPDAFLPAVEQTNIMRPLTERVLHDAIAQAVVWRDAGRTLEVAVNVAAPNLLDLGFPATVRRVLAEHGADARLLRLEVTEDAVLVDVERASQVLAELRGLHVGVSIDDFGTGHSSLARLRNLPVDELKIDRSFVRTDDVGWRDAAIVRAAAMLGRELGLTVVVEGVEDAGRWHDVREMQCDLVQGYLASRPLPAAGLDAWLAGWDDAPPAWLAERRAVTA